MDKEEILRDLEEEIEADDTKEPLMTLNGDLVGYIINYENKAIVMVPEDLATLVYDVNKDGKLTNITIKPKE